MRRVRAVAVAATAAQTRRLDGFARVGRAALGAGGAGRRAGGARVGTADLGAHGDLAVFAKAGVAAVGIGDAFTVGVVLAFDHTLRRWN